MTIFSTININQGICGCDGSIIVNTFNGNPPYSYSIDGGVSFRNTPLFTNLCPGTYSVVVTDISGFSTTNTITLNKPSDPISYLVYLTTSSSVLQNNGVTLTRMYDTSISVNPPLPDGVYITFDLTHTNSTKTSPSITASTTTTNTSLVIDSININPTLTGVTTGETYNSIPGCQSETLYLKTSTDSWTTLTLSGNSSFSLTTTTSIVKNVNENCYLASSEEFYTLSNLKIYGCSCCSVTNT